MHGEDGDSVTGLTYRLDQMPVVGANKIDFGIAHYVNLGYIYRFAIGTVLSTICPVRLIVASSAARHLLGCLCCNNVVYSQQQACALHGRLHTLLLNGQRLPNAKLPHVHDLACIAVDAPRATIVLSILEALCMFGAELCENLDRAVSGVLNECAGNDLHGLGNSLVWPLCDTLDLLGSPLEANGDRHFCGSTSWAQLGVPDDIPGYTHGVVEVALNLVQDILGGTTQ